MKLEKKALGISLYLFIASFFSERLWFNSDHLNLHNSIYIITKVMLLFTLIILGQVLYKGIIMVLQKDEKKGCRSAVGGDGLILSAIFVSSALIKGKKKIKEEKHEN